MSLAARASRSIRFSPRRERVRYRAGGREIPRPSHGIFALMRTKQTSRRKLLKTGLALAGLGLVSVPEWVLPALAEGETVVPFLDFPERVVTNPAVDRRIIDIRTINGPFTPKDKFATTSELGDVVIPLSVPPPTPKPPERRNPLLVSSLVSTIKS